MRVWLSRVSCFYYCNCPQPFCVPSLAQLRDLPEGLSKKPLASVRRTEAVIYVNRSLEKDIKPEYYCPLADRAVGNKLSGGLMKAIGKYQIIDEIGTGAAGT